MIHRYRHVALAFAASLALAACGDDDSGTPSAGSSVVLTTGGATTTSSSSSTTTPATSSPTTSTGSIGPTATSPPPTTTAPQEGTVPTTGSSVESAVADLAARLDTAADLIEVVSVEDVTWPDGSLGCPEPGLSYTQALVNGSRIVLSADGIEYEYHAGRNGEPFYCPAERVAGPVSGGGSGDT